MMLSLVNIQKSALWSKTSFWLLFQTELRKVQTTAAEFRREADIKRQIADRKVRLVFFCSAVLFWRYRISVTWTLYSGRSRVSQLPTPPCPALNPYQCLLNHLYVYLPAELWKIPCVLTPNPCQYVFNRNLIYAYLLAELWKIPRHWTWSLASTWKTAVMTACLSTTAVASSRCTRKWGHRLRAECKCSCKFFLHRCERGTEVNTQVGWKTEMCTYFHLCMIHLVVLSVFVWKKCFFVLDLSSSWCRS